MSVWAHANGVIMLSDLFFDEDEKDETIKIIKEDILGKTVEYGEDCIGFTTYMPCGSEGSLDYKIIECSGYTNIIICGNLRDYYEIKDLETWYKNVIDKLNNLKGIYVREHVFSAYIEYGDKIIITNPKRHDTYDIEYEVIKCGYNESEDKFTISR